MTIYEQDPMKLAETMYAVTGMETMAQEIRARRDLYGPDTRSGTVEQVPRHRRWLFPPTFDGTSVSLWMNWDSVVWFPEGRHSVRAS